MSNPEDVRQVKKEEKAIAILSTPFTYESPDSVFNMEFMKGYTRNVHTMSNLLSALVKAMDKHPHLRAGQLLFVILARALGTKTPEDSDVGSLLFNIYDEDLIKALEEYSK